MKNYTPVEIAASFFSAYGDPRSTSIDFSLDGKYFLSTHTDDAMRLVDVTEIKHKETIALNTVGLWRARFTQSSGVVCLASHRPCDGHLYLLNLNTAQLFASMSFVSDTVPVVPAIPNRPAYTAIAQSPCNDTIAAVFSAQGRLLLFHPLISGAVAASAENTFIGGGGAISFSPEGTQLLVSDDSCVRVYDYRKLFSGPLLTLQHNKMLPHCDSCGERRCIGMDIGSGGEELLLTYECGGVLLYDLRQNAVRGANFGIKGTIDGINSSCSVGARYVHPYLGHSPVVQLDSTSGKDTRLLVYHGSRAKSRWGSLRYEILCVADGDPIAMSVNPQYSMVATAAGGVTWWSFPPR
ncbi:uncharacterized protein TEOVI_000502000 [Trypanosoma equiperdum]|uniref:Uncharacterized protein n=2 Tax=Trypanozoon TaxID=39700 RepID=Q381F0_TRYB2|nr:hypothetical protein, conserved [Trypanosoma brucei brucei TREU927]EAN80581.1 hypothetical protein, conserved [Trypanosoma brucei brucei TREU927]SCU67343.1 hypothetical protein, conserved [Trypanosoma equiperdum]